METVNAAVASVLTYVETVIGTITSNGILTTLFAGGTIVPLAVRIYRRIKNSAYRG